MMEVSYVSRSAMERIYAFIWQHLWLVVSLFIMTLGVALCLRSNLGSSVISTIPFVMSIAGEGNMAPTYTIGEYTYIMNFILVFIQILILRRKFELIQLLQLIIGFLFGFLLDINVVLTEVFADLDTLLGMGLLQLAGCIVLALGITLEIRCGSITMPGEGVPAALSKAFGWQFAKAKIRVDISLVVIAVIIGYFYFNSWLWQVVGSGTLMAMILVGALVKIINPHCMWFDNLLDYRPGIGRYVYGLAKTLFHKNS
ncbi:MAG: DUF6198 family protein [Muribaculaceae bacterium]|nr:DUF6198 family protein [Muribaculaceae bacterium]